MIHFVNCSFDGRPVNTSEIYKQLKKLKDADIETIVAAVKEGNEKYKDNPSVYGTFVRSVNDLRMDLNYAGRDEERKQLAEYVKTYTSWAEENFTGKDLEEYNRTRKGEDEGVDLLSLFGRNKK